MNTTNFQSFNTKNLFIKTLLHLIFNTHLDLPATIKTQTPLSSQSKPLSYQLAQPQTHPLTHFSLHPNYSDLPNIHRHIKIYLILTGLNLKVTPLVISKPSFYTSSSVSSNIVISSLNI